MIDNTKEYILCAAIKRKVPKDCTPYWEGTNDICSIEIGYRHHDIFQRFNNEELSETEQGFYTSKGRYVDRYMGMEIAYNAGQVDEKTAFSKAWCDIKISRTDEIGEQLDSKEAGEKNDMQKFNMLFSEDLY